MKRRAAVYSASGGPRLTPTAKRAAPPAAKPPAGKAKPSKPPRWFATRRVRVAAGATAAAILLGAFWFTRPAAITQQQVEALVQRALEAVPPTPSATDAYEKIRPSVVAVRGMADDGEEGTKGMETGKADVQRGTGVVIVDSGLILTNLHVVAGARRVHVTFFDGHDTEAEVVGTRPEHDLAVLQAKSLPDDMMPAVMRSTDGLAPGDPVVAVGFPFGIGPSVSSGVISGLRRDYVSPEGKRVLTNLIQFDAAVNPGNSGGPLITLDGELVGIVTGLLNPSEQRVFIGIGFAVPIENAASAIGLNPF
ncbi:MAG TPA: trypsin-like peptidase domain-containing protein [Burkholderiales bacterium]|nr:trypsin-like peptidase domain-containing protein [Burkholderiales bacterium]